MEHIRQSNFELMRILSMFLIIWYHIFIFVFEVDNPGQLWYKALQMPMHIGVPLFVMISGYFGIRFSFKSILGGVISRLYVYAVPIALFIAIRTGGNMKDIINSFFVLGQHNFWFVNTYLCLYIVAPAITPWFDNANKCQRWITLIGLALFTIYTGNLKMTDPTLIDGKNLLNFIFIYFIGRMLNYYQDTLTKISSWKYIVTYVVLVMLSLFVFTNINNTYIQTRLWLLFYPYNSPMLLMESCIIFILFGKLQIQSGIINKIASSVFAMYILHGATFGYIANTVRLLNSTTNDKSIQIILSFLLVVAIIIASTCIDRMFSPLWKYVSRQGQKLDNWYNRY